MNILNLYAGLGGNRKLWENVQVTSVENDERIAQVYAELYPDDKLIIADAHAYLLDNFEGFDFIWSSPPCQTHSRMFRSGRHKNHIYPDLRLYQEIIFLQHHFTGKWVVENVVPYYKPLIEPQRIGRHCFWSNFVIQKVHVPSPAKFADSGNTAESEEMKKWLGIHYKGNIYYKGNHDPNQVLRNCTHPLMGKAVIDSVVNNYQRQHGLFEIIEDRNLENL